jgi:hypothetical protein
MKNEKGPCKRQGPFLSPVALGGRPGVLFRLLIEFLLALIRAEVEFLAAILRLILRIVLVNIHSANRVFGHKVSLSLMIFFLHKFSRGPDQFALR